MIGLKIWARAIREEIKPDEDGDVRAISAVIASFTRLVYPSEIKIFMDWCGKNGYQDLCDEFNTWHFDTKASGQREDDNKIKAEALQKYIKEENKRKKKEVIFGGLVIKEGEHFRINSDEKYQPFKLATEVREKTTEYKTDSKYLKNKKGGNILSFSSFSSCLFGGQVGKKSAKSKCYCYVNVSIFIL